MPRRVTRIIGRVRELLNDPEQKHLTAHKILDILKNEGLYSRKTGKGDCLWSINKYIAQIKKESWPTSSIENTTTGPEDHLST